MKKNLIFIEYYRLVSFKFGISNAIKWIFAGKLNGERYLDCCYWNKRWQSVFENYSLNPDKKTLNDYFSYQILRYYQSTYPPSVKSLFSLDSIFRFKKVYGKKYFNYLIRKPYEYRYNRKLLERKIEPLSRKTQAKIDDQSKENCIRQDGKGDLLIKMCLLANIYYNEESYICKECDNLIECKKRIEPV